MSTVKGKVDSEDEKASTLTLAAGAYNVALIFQEPDMVTMSLNAPQDTARWRLSSEMTLMLDKGERITASYPTITLPPVHHKNQLVAMWRWPLSSNAGRGLISTVTFRWECDRPRTTANVIILAVPSGVSHACGLFAVPFPGHTDVLDPFDSSAINRR